MTFADIEFVIKNIYGVIVQSREKRIAQLLLRNALKLATVESCTGGLISSRMTDVSGSSAYIFQNLVTYANEAKVKMLGVNRETIEKYGVVSEQVALEMVKGMLDKYNCGVAMSTTGIAGPLGATEEKPVGLIYIGIGNDKIQKAYRFEANPKISRRLMKYAFSNKALDLLIEFLEENY